MDLVFEAKEKQMTLKLYGKEFKIRVPKLSESVLFQSNLKTVEAKDATKLYTEFFLSLGMPQEAIDLLDSLDYNELLSFVLYPKKS